tara:strand:+ start:5917 stop:6633 length:717 start_codon:yes stop_codon:yes gene_type:complete
MEGKTFSFKCLEKNIKSVIKTFQRKMRLISYRESFETDSSDIPENEPIDVLYNGEDKATQINIYNYLKIKYGDSLMKLDLYDKMINKEWKLSSAKYNNKLFTEDPQDIFNEYILYTFNFSDGLEFIIKKDKNGNTDDESVLEGYPNKDNSVTDVSGQTTYRFDTDNGGDGRIKKYIGTIDGWGSAVEILTSKGVRYGTTNVNEYIQDCFACLVNEIDVLNKYVNHLQKVNRMGDDMMI